jgi:hypothetical protein
MTQILEQMLELRRKKNEGQTVHLVDRFPKLTELTAMTFLGSFSWTCTATKERWILRKMAYDLGAGWMTPSDIARDYIEAKFGNKPLRCNTRQWQEVIRKRKHQPLYAKPCTLPTAYYLDMKSAYWQLLQLGGYDVDYMPSRYLSPRSDVYDFPVPSLKLARNCIVSMGLPSGVNVWLPESGFQRKKSKKASVNLILWGFIQDVLHGFASDMVTKANACYVNTDGYIVPQWAMPLAEEVADSWGLTLGLKEMGEAVIRGAGDYDIGNHISSRVRITERPFKYIEPREKEWLRKKVKFWSKRINLEQRDSVLAYNA